MCRLSAGRQSQSLLSASSTLENLSFLLLLTCATLRFSGLGLSDYFNMAPKIEYYCPCLAESPHPPPPHLPSSSYSFHPLHNLFFCEECDAVRCNRCVLVEVSGYYCPNCLFEVPSASVRAEKNRFVHLPIVGSQSSTQ